jgi:hypothetical protein
MYKIELNWIDFKSYIINQDFSLNYKKLYRNESFVGYEVFVIDRLILWRTTLLDSNDIADFETNYKNNCNQCVYSKIKIIGSDNIAEVTDDGKLKVLADISSGASISTNRFLPKLYQDITDNSVSANTEETIFEFDGDGQLDYISIVAEKKKWEIILEVDNIEIYRLNLEYVRDKHKLNEPTDYIHTDSSAEFVDMYPTPVDFLSKLKIKVKNLDDSSKYIRAVLVRYREKA